MMNTPENSQEQDQAPYYEFARGEFVPNMEEILRRIIPLEFNIGSEDELGDIRFRFFNLPEDSEEKKQTLDKVREIASDRTNSSIRSMFESLYEKAADKAGVRPIDVMDTMSAVDFRRHSKALLKPSKEVHLGANGLLIYDAKTDKGIINIQGPEYTFKDLNDRKKALLAIIELK